MAGRSRGLGVSCRDVQRFERIHFDSASRVHALTQRSQVSQPRRAVAMP